MFTPLNVGNADCETGELSTQYLNSIKPDYIAAWVCIVMFYIYFAQFTVIET